VAEDSIDLARRLGAEMRHSMWVGRARALALGLIGLALVVSGSTASGSEATAAAPSPARTPTVFLSPTGSDAGPCTRARPCASFMRAFRSARADAVVELAAGTYPHQRVEPGPSKSGNEVVTFRPAPGAAVDVAGVLVEGGTSHVAFEDMTFTGPWEVGRNDGGPRATDVTFRRIRGTQFYIMNASKIRVLGGIYGPAVDGQSQIKVWNPDDSYAPEDILVQGVRFHDFTRTNGRHTECLQIYAGIDVTVRGNYFRNCDGTGSLTVVRLFAAPVRNVLVENNMFESGDGVDDPYYDVQTDVCTDRVVFRYNSFTKGLLINDCPGEPSGAMTILGNYGVASLYSVCGRASVTYGYNVWVGDEAGRCGRTDRVRRRAQFKDPKGKDLHLDAGASAINAGDPRSFPRTDIDGTRRPVGARPDAGADEARPSPCRAKKGKTCS
jgi:hypothetical protein